jgi:hypothetical protein
MMGFKKTIFATLLFLAASWVTLNILVKSGLVFESVTTRTKTSKDSGWGVDGEQLLQKYCPSTSSCRLSEAKDGNLYDLKNIQRIFHTPDVSQSVIHPTELWEFWSDNDVGYPTVIRNTKGINPDGRYYLFYSSHGVPAGIASAVADKLQGPYKKISTSILADSRVLIPPIRPWDTSHYSSPQVIWNPDAGLWHLYFHYYLNEFDKGLGHQKTALAVSPELAVNKWEIIRGADGGIMSVLPVSSKGWMNSQSSYHHISRAGSGLWIALLRGTGGAYRATGKATDWEQDTTAIGLAFSADGFKWHEYPGNPVLRPNVPPVRKQGVIRPVLLGIWGDQICIVWSESDYYDSNRVTRYAVFNDLRLDKPPVFIGEVDWVAEDGPASVAIDGETIGVFTGRTLKLYSKN